MRSRIQLCVPARANGCSLVVSPSLRWETSRGRERGERATNPSMCLSKGLPGSVCSVGLHRERCHQKCGSASGRVLYVLRVLCVCGACWCARVCVVEVAAVMVQIAVCPCPRAIGYGPDDVNCIVNGLATGEVLAKWLTDSSS